MKKILISTFLLFTLISSIFAQTNVNGGIYSNTTWTLANSPYILTGSVVIFPGKTLTIEPGVEVRVQGNSTNTANQLYLEVRGNLTAIGNTNAPISFISDIPNETYYTWYGINIKGDQGGSVNLDYITLKNTVYGLTNNIISYDTISMKGCNFMYNNYSVSMNTNFKFDSCSFSYNGCAIGWMISYGSVKTNNCIFDHNVTNITSIANGVDLNNSTFSNTQNGITQVSGKINNCLFNNNLIALQECGSLNISNSSFLNNGEAIKGLQLSSIQNCDFASNGIALELKDNSNIENNTLNNNQVGLALSVNTPGQLVSNVKNNQICYNTLYNVENRTDVNLGVEQNCFCETDSTIIENKIYDGYDDITRGLINYAIYDSACNIATRYVIKVNLGTSAIDKETLAASLRLYPNPSTKEIRVETQNPKLFNSTLQILDLNGRILKTNLSYTNGIAVIDVSDLPNGVYMLMENASANRQLFVKQ